MQNSVFNGCVGVELELSHEVSSEGLKPLDPFLVQHYIYNFALPYNSMT